MAFDPAFLDELRARTPIAAAIGRRTKLSRSGRNWKACCPFHGEKTASFIVYDDHFHCFGCGAHGDVISFVMQSSGQSFHEAVTMLAAEAGLELPRQDPIARERAEARATLARSVTDALQAAQRCYAGLLHGREGRTGLAYLRGRGLSEATIEAFGLGWSGDGRALGPELRRQGFDAVLMAEAGLMRRDEAGRPIGELFFNRITFPIRARDGTLISFGARALGDAQPKYLNGPETVLFSKRLTLFGLDRARAALRTPRPGASRPGQLIVAEGYLDVIALDQAGFAGAVAPLGTALTPEQLEMAWRLSPSPVLCFDGDAAGRRAAIRAAETALPLLQPERSLRFCRLPEGEDPDSLLRRQGVARMRAALDGALPIGEVLFDLLSEGVGNPGPEQRAALRARLVEAAQRIGDRTLAAEYRRTLLDRFYEAARARRPGRELVKRPTAPRAPPEPQSVRGERLRILTAILLRHPELLPDVEEAYCSLEMPTMLGEVRDALLRWVAHAPRDAGTADGADLSQTTYNAREFLDSQALMDHLTGCGFSAIVESVVAREPAPPGETEEMPAELERRWWHFFGLLNLDRLESELLASKREWVERNDETSHRRLRALSEACASLRAGEQAGDDG